MENACTIIKFTLPPTAQLVCVLDIKCTTPMSVVNRRSYENEMCHPISEMGLESSQRMDTFHPTTFWVITRLQTY